MLINFKNRASPAIPHSSNNNFSFDDSKPNVNYQSPNHETPTSTQKETLTKNDDIIQLEETQEDCVYQVTIKKVYINKNLTDVNNNELNNITSSKSSSTATYRPLASSFFSYVSHDSSYSSNSSTNTTNDQSYQPSQSDGLVYTRVKTRQLKYATMPKFIEHLTNLETGHLDSHLVQIFLVTYRTFTDTLTAIKLLEKRYEQIVPASLEMTEDVRLEHLKSFRSIVYMWLENYSEDFVCDPPQYTNLNELNRFAQKHFTQLSGSPDILQLIQSKFNATNNITNTVPFPPPAPPTKVTSDSLID